MKGTRGHCLKLRKLGAPGISLGIFSNRVVNRWNPLDQRTVDVPNMNAFKNDLSKTREIGWASL